MEVTGGTMASNSYCQPRLMAAGRIFLPWLVLPVLLLLPTHTAAKSYQIARADISARLHADGSMDVTESRTYEFEGTFSFAYRTLPRGAPEDFVDFLVMEDGQPYRLSESEEPGTYRVDQSGSEYEVRWFFDAKNESRTFDLQFRVVDLVRKYQDAAVLYYQVIGDEFDKTTSKVLVNITPPQTIDPAQINAWLHGPLWAEYTISENGEISAICEDLPRKTFLEINVLYPVQLFPEATPRKGLVRQTVTEEEARWVAEANQRRENATRSVASRQSSRETGKLLMPILAVLGILTWLPIYRLFGRRRSAPPTLQETPAIPDDTPPALVEYLVNGRQVTAQAMVATLMDLARRGYLTLTEEPREEKGWFGKSRSENHHIWHLKRDHYDIFGDGLLNYEVSLIQFLFDEIAREQDAIDLEELSDHRREFRNFFREWKLNVQAEGKKKGYWDQRSLRGMKYSLILAITLMVSTVPLFFMFGLWALFMEAAGFVVLMLSFTIPKRTPSGEIKARRWLALKTYLKKHRYRLKELPTWREHIESVFIYGVIFRLSERTYKDLSSYLKTEPARAPLPWYTAHGNGSGGFDAAAFSSSFASMVSVANSAVSTSAGTGGGATGGGGGGAGGGGGGAG